MINTPIPLFKVFMSPHARDAVGDVLDSGFIGEGPKVREFESMLRDKLGTDLIATTNSCTSALHLAIHLIKTKHNLTSDDEVLATPLTCTATNWPILANGLKIKWVDIDPKTMNMDLDDLERKITNRTKIILIVHWAGYPVDLDRLKQIQINAENNFSFKPELIEDCAHGFGSTYGGKPLGNHGNFACYSFQAIKHLTTGDGGALICPNREYYSRAKLIRWYGIDRETNKKDFRCEADVPEWGYKFHMNDIAAAIGIENLKLVDTQVIQKNMTNGDYYDNELKSIPEITLLERCSNRKSSRWIYSMLVNNRDRFMEKMKQSGITVSQVHERNDIHSCAKEYRCSLPTLDKYIKRLVCIPNGWWVTDKERDYIIKKIREGW